MTALGFAVFFVSAAQAASGAPATTSDAALKASLGDPIDPSLASSGPEPGTGLTLTKVLQETLAAGFEVRLSNIAVDAAKGDAKSFAAVANPSVSLGVGRALGYDATQCAHCSAYQYSVGLSDQAMLSNYLSGKYGLRKDVSRSTVRVASLQRDDALRLIKVAAKQQFAALVVSQARLRLSERVLRSAQHTEDLVRARYNSGAPLPDLLRAEAVVLDAQQRVRAAQIQLISDKAQLALMMGRKTLENVDFDEALLTAPPPFVEPPPSVARWTEQAQNARPDRLAAEAAVEQSEAQLRLARRERWPDIELQLGYTQQGMGNNAIQPATVSVALSAPIPVIYQNQGQLERATADASSRSIERKRLDMQIASAVKTSLAKVASAWGQAQNAEQRLMRARKAVEMVRLQYEEGATSLVDLLEATNSSTDAEDNYLEAKLALWNQVFQLEYDSGKDLVQ